jgi:hypothetical protein
VRNPKAMQISRTILILTTLLTACGGLYYSNYDFDLRANYRVEKTALQASVRTQGFVGRGQDIAENPSLIRADILVGNRNTITINLSGSQVLRFSVNAIAMQTPDSTNLAACLFAGLRQLRKGPIDSLEIVALSDAILSTGAGPKGAIFKGQRDLVLVDTVYYSTKDR